VKIKDVQIDGFGVWSGLHVDSMPEVMTVFYGPNEAGKTTLMQFLRTMFYGFTAERRQRYMPPIHGGRPGGAMRVTGPGGGYEIQRRATMNESGVAGTLAVTGADGLTQGQHRLSMLLGQVDESIFTNVFAIGLRELQELSTLDDTAAADELYKLSSGLDRVSLVDVIRQLRTARTNLINSSEAGQIPQLMLRREKLKDEIEEHASRGRRWTELAAQRRSQAVEISELQERVSQWEHEGRTIETSLQVRAPWQQRAELQRQLKLLNARTELPYDASDKLKAIAAELQQRKERLDDIRNQRHELRRKATGLPIRRSILELASRIDAASEQAPWIASLQKQVQRLRQQVTVSREQLAEDAKRLGLNEHDVEALLTDRRLANMPDLNKDTIARLAGPAREVRQHIARLRHIKSQSNNDAKEAKELELQLNAVLTERGQTDLHEAMAAQAELIGNLRKRLQLQDRLERLLRTKQELEDEAIDLGTEEAFPMEKAFLLALPFIGGGFLILSGICKWFGTGFFDQDQSTGTLWVLSGILLLFFWYMWRQLSDRNTVSDLDDCEDQLEAVLKQIRKAELERDDFDKHLPVQSDAIELRLQRAEDDLAELESMLPLHHNYLAVRQRQQQIRKKGTESARALRSARADWQKTLKSLGLAEGISPKTLRIMSEGYELLMQGRNRLKAQEDELQQRELELIGIVQRLDGLVKQISASSKREGSEKPTKDSVTLDLGGSRDSSREQGNRPNRDQNSNQRNDRNRRDSNEAKPAVVIREALDTSKVDSLSKLDPLELIQQLQLHIGEQKHYLAQRKELKEQDLQFAKLQHQVQKACDKFVRSRQTLLAELGVESPDHLDEQLTLKRRHEKLMEQIRESDDRIRVIIGSVAPYDTIARMLEGTGSEDLEKRWENLQNRQAQTQVRIAQLFERQGELQQEMKSLALDKRLAEAKLELACLEKQIQAATSHWQTLAATTFMLEKVCEVYENERQPETLREASSFLKNLSDGKYVRVWTPLGKNALRIDNAQGQSLPLEVLSRGTREAVFIALRLALASAYSRRGVNLPLVLDDVLVNFDSNRATAAARVLRDFAEMGHQVIMFTCHEHIMRIFYDIGVQVRVLPQQGVAGEARIYEPARLTAHYEVEPEEVVPLAPVAVSQPEPTVVEVITETVVEEPVVVAPPPAPEPEPEVEEQPEPEVYVYQNVRKTRRSPKPPTINHFWYNDNQSIEGPWSDRDRKEKPNDEPPPGQGAWWSENLLASEP
jgi:uncharacterized protein YhaN